MGSDASTSAQPVRLRRTVRSFLTGELTLMGLCLGLFFVGGAVISGLHSKSWLPLGFGALFLAVPVHSLWVRISLTDRGIGIRRIRPIVIERESIYRIGPGPVPWGRGDPVEGIEIQTIDGKRMPMPYSAFLGNQRRDQWVAAVDAWLGIDSKALPCIAKDRNLTRPVSFGRKTFPYHDPSWID